MQAKNWALASKVLNLFFCLQWRRERGVMDKPFQPSQPRHLLCAWNYVGKKNAGFRFYYSSLKIQCDHLRLFRTLSRQCWSFSHHHHHHHHHRVFQIGTYAGGGGRPSCPGNNGGNGGKVGGAAGGCYDNTAAGGNAGSANRGGGGGSLVCNF